jgi:hypothetical protein
VYVNSLTWKIVEVHSRITDDDQKSLVFAKSMEACLLATLLYSYFSKLFVRFCGIFVELPQYILDHLNNHTLVKSSVMCTPNCMVQLPTFRKVRNTFVIKVELLFFLELLNNEVEGTMVQDGRSQVRFSLLSIGFFVDVILPAAL